MWFVILSQNTPLTPSRLFKRWLQKTSLRQCALGVLLLFTTGVVSGCDSLSDLILPDQDTEVYAENEDVGTSNEAYSLIIIVENQERIVDDMQQAKESGDRELLLQLYDEFMREDESYHLQFESKEDVLSRGEALSISGRYSTLVKKIPRMSEVMK